MNIELWQAMLGVVVAAAAAWAGSRWWALRELNAASQRLAKLDATHQSTLRMLSQARKQVDDLQRLVAEYRRKLTAMELARRRRIEIEQVVPDTPAPTAANAPALPAMRLPGAWADTQPL